MARPKPRAVDYEKRQKRMSKKQREDEAHRKATLEERNREAEERGRKNEEIRLRDEARLADIGGRTKPTNGTTHSISQVIPDK